MMQGFRDLVRLHEAHQAERRARVSGEKLAAELSVLDEALNAARSVLIAAQTKLELITGRRREAEKNAAALEEQRKKYRGQLMEAKTNDVYKTLLAEIETATERVSECETIILNELELAEPAEAAFEAAKSALAMATVENKGERQRLQAEIERLAAEQAKAAEAAAVVEATVPKRLLPPYKRILAGRDGKAMARVADQHCMECHVQVRPQVWVDILKETQLHYCPCCGRILYRLTKEEEAALQESEAAETAAATATAEGGGQAEASPQDAAPADTES